MHEGQRVTLEAVSRKGHERLARDGHEWEVVRVSEVQFARGQWVHLQSVVDPVQGRWVRIDQPDDHFRIIEPGE